MKRLLHSHHPFRIFFISGLLTIVSLALVGYYFGPEKAFIALVLILVEITFSFENAIINAKVLGTMSRFWQQMFMTVGIFIAVFGMRLVFPIVIVMVTAGLPASDVINLALNQPDEYAAELYEAHASIAAFGGMFLLMLCLHFFFDTKRKILWIDIIEKPLQDMSRWWLYTTLCVFINIVIALLPWNKHAEETLVAGFVGIGTYVLVHGLAELFARHQAVDKSKVIARAGMAGFMSFLYLEVLDASFSFDSVIGAFAVTKEVVIIAIGLGIGALWVRSLTLFMVRKRVLHVYRYLEHGAHYTIGVLAIVLLLGIFFDIPEVIAGVGGIIIVSISIVSSMAFSKQAKLDGTID
jgi:hypothetical protein